MPVANFIYQSNHNNRYQVTVPEDFAFALQMELATGSEPYLDNQISPRYLNYLGSGGITRSALCGDPNTFGNPPATLLVDGVLYSLRSQVGENIPSFLNPTFLTAVGPQGSKGDQGPQGIPGPVTTAVFYEAPLAADTPFSGTSGFHALGFAFTEAGAAHLVQWSITVQNVDSVDQAGQIRAGDTTGTYFQVQPLIVPAGTTRSFAGQYITTTPTAVGLFGVLDIAPSGASCVVLGANGGSPVSIMSCLRLSA